MSDTTEPPQKKSRKSRDTPSRDTKSRDTPSRHDIPFNETRVKQLHGTKWNEFPERCTGVAYYMHRDQRIHDNWAMVYAAECARDNSVPLHVVCLMTSRYPDHAGATLRHYQFCFEGLKEVAAACAELNIAFHLLLDQGSEKGGGECIVEWMNECSVNCLITDFSPLRPHKRIINQILTSGKLPECNIFQVDAHNIVPVEVTSDKQEYGARTIRKKITSKLPTYLTEFPPIEKHGHGNALGATRYFGDKKGVGVTENWDELLKTLVKDETVKPVARFVGGASEGLKMLEEFVEKRIKKYSDQRNDPTVDALSNLSPWFHMGNLSVQRAVLYVKKHAPTLSATFIEESVVRRELSDNFCHYNNDHYDKITGASAWAQTTLDNHRKDTREYVYTRSEFESAKTHDELWNAAQRQLMSEGKMHGFMRMYWAKKILEWTESPEKALEDALYFNDHYSLDGSDANGFVGCMWSICGVHDQGWAERPVFGKIRYMNFNGCKRKFDVDEYIRKHGSKGDIKKYFK